MRSITFGYPDLATLAMDLKGEDSELPLPSGQRGTSGEWVLAVFKVDDSTATSAAAARIEERDIGLVIVFEPRDWQRLSSELFGVASPARADRPPRSKRAPHSKRSPPTSSAKPASKGQSRTIVPRPSASPLPPVSQRGVTALTRTLVPPPSPEIHEADAPDRTLEAPIEAGSWRARSQPSSSKPTVPRLLLVEDDHDMQTMIREMLDAIGLQVECVDEGEQALDRLVLERFDLVVLDWNLPGMSGLELCREIRRHPRVGATPVLFLTGKSSSRDLVDAFAAGADDFVAKPFRAPELGARLLALLRRAKIGLSVPPPAE